MEADDAIAAFAALSQTKRLRIVQRLVAAYPGGVTPGTLCRDLDVRPNTLSSNLSVLLNAGLVRRTRNGREVLYAADAKGLQALTGFLLRDCCGGHPELCPPVSDVADSAV